VQSDFPRWTDDGHDATGRVLGAAGEVVLSRRQHAVLRDESGFRSASTGHGHDSQFSTADFVPGSGGGFIGFDHRRDSFSFPGSDSFSTGK
jgi:hypothetical protein